MPQHQDLDVLRPCRPYREHEQIKNTPHGQVDKRPQQTDPPSTTTTKGTEPTELAASGHHDEFLHPTRFAGRAFNRSLLDELPAGVDPCGENGEFHTFVHAGPIFTAPIICTHGRTVERDGFVFCDLRAESGPATLGSAK
jgi:Diphthamide synthase